MTAFKAGDAVVSQGKWCDVYPGAGRVISHAGKEWVLYEHLGHEYCLQRCEFEKRFEKVEPFFEVGKTYTRRAWEFRPVRIDTETWPDGVQQKVAYGELTAPGSIAGWTMLVSGEFDRWTEKR